MSMQSLPCSDLEFFFTAITPFLIIIFSLNVLVDSVILTFSLPGEPD